MRLDSLIRLIEAADFMSFRELALECLSIKGYQSVELADGWSDGGTDVRVYQFPPNPTPIAFQITVERDWRSKLRDDAHKVRTKLNLAHLTLVTSRRVPEADFIEEADRLWSDLGVRATRLDGPAIATTFFREARTTRVLEILGINEPAIPVPGIRSDARADAAYSFVFFGRDTQRFREATIESAVFTVATGDSPPTERRAFENAVRTLLQLHDTQVTRVTSVIDRMIQSGDLTGRGGTLLLSDKLADAARAARLLRDKDWQDLRSSLQSLLLKRGVSAKSVESAIDAVLSDVGAVLLESAQNAFASMTQPSDSPTYWERIRKRLRHLHATLDSVGVPEGTERDATLAELATVASNSPIGKCILAGELFLLLSANRLPELIRALGARSAVEVLLDSSVAIPVLCSLMYKPVGYTYSLSAYHAYSLLMAHGLRVVIPLDYLEESCTHLLAAHDYSAIIEQDTDLTGSRNAYVSHYASLRQEGRTTSFSTYLTSFGLDESLRRADFVTARDALKPRLQRLLDRYSIEVAPLGYASSASFSRAQDSVSRALEARDIPRPPILKRHDVRTIAYLYEGDRAGEVARVLCTWDSVHFWIREREQSEWQVLNPAVLGDILALVKPDDLGSEIAGPTIIAKSLSEEAAMHGAEIWDRIAQIERGGMCDAELLGQARAFKDDYLKTVLEGRQARDIGRAWAEWKAAHSVGPVRQEEKR